MSTKISGLTELNNKFAKAIQEMPHVSAQALQEVAMDLLAKSANQAPLDKGDLRKSATIHINGDLTGQANEEGNVIQTKKPRGKSKNTGIVAYNEEYALRQHEEMEWRHTTGNAKFLERPFHENINNYIKFIKRKSEEVGE